MTGAQDPYELQDLLDQHAARASRTEEYEEVEPVPPFLIKVTGYRLLNTAVIVGFGIPKAVLAARGNASANTLDWILGVAFAVLSYWIGLFEPVRPPVLRWLLHDDYAPLIIYPLRFVKTIVVTGLSTSIAFHGCASMGSALIVALYTVFAVFVFVPWALLSLGSSGALRKALRTALASWTTLFRFFLFIFAGSTAPIGIIAIMVLIARQTLPDRRYSQLVRPRASNPVWRFVADAWSPHNLLDLIAVMLGVILGFIGSLSMMIVLTELIDRRVWPGVDPGFLDMSVIAYIMLAIAGSFGVDDAEETL